MVKSNLCSGCSEELHENCWLCHNEDCDLYTEEKYCEDCGEELCYSCDGMCHECTSKENENSEDIVDDPEPQDGDDWISSTIMGITAVRPVAAMFAVPSEKDHDVQATIGVLVIRIYPEMLKDFWDPTVDHKSFYRVISFHLSWANTDVNSISKKMTVLPVGFRVSALFTDHSPFQDIFLYAITVLQNHMHPIKLNNGKWVVRMLIDVDEAFGQYILHEAEHMETFPLNFKGLKSSIEHLEAHGYDYSDFG